VQFRLRLNDKGELEGGNIQLHKANPSTTAGPGFFELREWEMCGDLDRPE
jgi:hypothetical protein